MPVSLRHTIEIGSRTASEPPTTAPIVGAANFRRLVVVDVRRTERHSVCMPHPCGSTDKGVTSVAMVAGHVQRVVVVL